MIERSRSSSTIRLGNTLSGGQLKKFVTNSATIRRNVARSPNSSRMRSLSPLPVTAPMRDDISWMTTSAMVIGIIVQSSE